ncbi:MAG: DNA-binding protein [Clostridiales bacterium]|jgi:predicted DNA-binding protein with PD1-like motif|nr:DNA-binding protein [Clostridiales bacterium]
MEYRVFNNNIIARIDKGEEILNALAEIAEREGIRAGCLSAIGAVDYLKAGLFDPKQKKYFVNVFEKDMEIVSLVGNISRMDGRPYLHAHISAADVNGAVVGGHLNEARVSLTCELVITVFEGGTGRKFDAETGLNLLDF